MPAYIGIAASGAGFKHQLCKYSTNLHIYTNILRIVKPTEKRILVLFGQGHIPILKHLFENNPDFEVIEVKEILK